MRLSVRTFVVGFVILFASASTGCDDGGPAPFPTDPPADYATFLQRLPSAYCEGLYQCPGSGDKGGNPDEWTVYRSESECRAYQADLVRHWNTPAEEAAHAAGLVRFDPQAAARCLEALRGLGRSGCEGARYEVAECRWFQVGTRGAGEPAGLSGECGPDTYSCTPSTGCSICEARPDARDGFLPGDPCTPNDPSTDCDIDLECVPDAEGAGTGTCQPEPPLPIAERDEPCGTISGTRTVCRRGLACMFGSEAPWTGTCRDPLPIGASCETPYGPTNPCMRGSECVWIDIETSVCKQVKVVGLGAPCVPSSRATTICSLADGLRCDERTYRCAPLGDGSEGTDCATDDGCDPGLACLAGQCLPFTSDGGSCVTDLQCESGHCQGDRPGTPGVCAPYSTNPTCP